MTRAAPAWHAEAKRLRAEGRSILGIARSLGLAHSSVRLALDEDGYRNRKNARRAEEIKSEAPFMRSDGSFLAHWEPRPPRQILDRAAIRAILDNREGSIPRAELMRRISVGGGDVKISLASQISAVTRVANAGPLALRHFVSAREAELLQQHLAAARDTLQWLADNEAAVREFVAAKGAA